MLQYFLCSYTQTHTYVLVSCPYRRQKYTWKINIHCSSTLRLKSMRWTFLMVFRGFLHWKPENPLKRIFNNHLMILIVSKFLIFSCLRGSPCTFIIFWVESRVTVLVCVCILYIVPNAHVHTTSLNFVFFSFLLHLHFLYNISLFAARDLK